MRMKHKHATRAETKYDKVTQRDESDKKYVNKMMSYLKQDWPFYTHLYDQLESLILV